MDKLKDDLA
jgi:dynein heavy chain